MDRKLDRHRPVQHLLATIFMMLPLPFIILLDIVVEIYHRVAFPLCQLDTVPRKKYIIMDRHKLSYLNWVDKIACVYCGYANGWARYITEIGAITEKYWCGIKHQKAQPHQKDFVKYGDEKAYRKKYKKQIN